MITVQLRSAEWSTYVDNARNNRMMLSLFGWYPDYIDPDNFLTPFLMTGLTSGRDPSILTQQ